MEEEGGKGRDCKKAMSIVFFTISSPLLPCSESFREGGEMAFFACVSKETLAKTLRWSGVTADGEGGTDVLFLFRLSKATAAPSLSYAAVCRDVNQRYHVPLPSEHENKGVDSDANWRRCCGGRIYPPTTFLSFELVSCRLSFL